MPPCAASKSPGRSWVAPVNAPLACPKSSLSRRFSGTAPTLIATKGPAARVDSVWMRRAIRSLPVPLSPVTRTVESTFAVRRASSMSFRMDALFATIPSGVSSPSAWARARCIFSFFSASMMERVTLSSASVRQRALK